MLKPKPPRPYKLSSAEIEELQAWEEFKRRYAEQKKAEKLEREQEADMIKLPKERMDDGIVEAKDERFSELALVMEKMSSSSTEANEGEESEKPVENEGEEKPDEMKIKPPKKLKITVEE